MMRRVSPDKTKTMILRQIITVNSPNKFIRLQLLLKTLLIILETVNKAYPEKEYIHLRVMVSPSTQLP
jgi:uncharacterized protein YsxB (DUF464 family)